MLELFFFILGIVNSAFLILIFLIRKNRLALLYRIGRVYLFLVIPAIYGIFLVAQEQKTVQYGIFLGIFLAFILLEWLFDFVLKINFRENWKKNWKWIVPYLGSLLRDELMICGNAVENLFTLGTRYALSFYHPDNNELEESPQNGWLVNPQQKTKYLSLLSRLCH